MQHNHHDHNKHHRMMIRDFRIRFIISSIVTIPVLVLSPMIQSIIGFQLTFSGAHYVLFAHSVFIYLYGGWPFVKGLYTELKGKQPGMMTLIALAISVAFIYSSAVVFGLEGRFFFWELATLVDIMLLGHWIEMRSVLSASAAVEELAQLMPDTAHRKRDERIEDIPIDEIRKGDVLLIKPGEKVPSDGIIVSGKTSVDESMLTGESTPVQKTASDTLIGGSINGDGTVELRVSNTGEESYLSQVIVLVRNSQAEKSKTQGLADKAAFRLTIISITVGIVTLITWLLVGNEVQFAIERMATVMVITCPHALGLAIPLVVAVSTTKSAKNGLLIRNRTAFENARKITTVLFDKTGTLTEGKFEVTDITTYTESFNGKKVLRIASALEQHSEHPIGRSIVKRAEQTGEAPPRVEDVSAVKGKGIHGTVDGKQTAIGNALYMEEQGLTLPPEEQSHPGGTRVYVQVGKDIVGSIYLADRIREDSNTAVGMLQEQGIKCMMITGDAQATAEKVSKELGMDGFFAEVLPDAKQEKVKELQAQGEFVAMTGDGVNDAPALAAADIGIAIGSGTDVAAETADIILVNSNPQDVASLILFGRATYKKMVQNLIWATGYNVVTIPLAAGILYGAGIIISPALGALLMSLSTIIVAINAKFLKVERVG